MPSWFAHFWVETLITNQKRYSHRIQGTGIFLWYMKVTIYQTLIASDELVDMINTRMLKIHPSCNLPGMQQTMGHFLASKWTWMIKFLKFIHSTVWCVNVQAIWGQIFPLYYQVLCTLPSYSWWKKILHQLLFNVITRFYTSQVVVWDFWIINSIPQRPPQIGARLHRATCGCCACTCYSWSYNPIYNDRLGAHLVPSL